MDKKLSFRSIFEKLKSIGTEILDSQAPIVDDQSLIFKKNNSQNNPQNNYQSIFKEEYDKSSDKLKKIIDNKVECFEFNQFIKRVISLSEDL